MFYKMSIATFISLITPLMNSKYVSVNLLVKLNTKGPFGYIELELELNYNHNFK